MTESRDFFEVVGGQRACRRFRPDPVDDALIAQILRSATNAPSSENKQPWNFVVVRDADRRAAIGAHLEAVWTRGAGGLERLKSRMPAAEVAAVDAGMRGGVAGAPVHIVVAGDLDRVPRQWMDSSIFPCIQNVLLAANAVGLGSALTTLAAADGSTLAGLLGLPDTIVPYALIPVGYPAKPLGPPRREPFETHTWREEYGTPW